MARRADTSGYPHTSAALRKNTVSKSCADAVFPSEDGPSRPAPKSRDGRQGESAIKPELRMDHELFSALMSGETRDEVAQAVCRALVPELADWCVFVIDGAWNEPEQHYARTIDPSDEGSALLLAAASSALLPPQPGMVALHLNGLEAARRAGWDDPQRALLSGLGGARVLSLRLRAGVAEPGRLLLGSKDNRLTMNDPPLLEALAAIAAQRLAWLNLRSAVSAWQADLRRIGHDLRTPLMPLVTASRVLREKAALPPQLVRYVEILERNAQATARLVDQVSELAARARKIQEQAAPANAVPEATAFKPEPASASTPESQGETAESKPPVGILLVDDHEDTLMLNKMLLERFGYHVETAASASEAVSVAEHRNFDVVVTDIALPDESGIELLRRLSQNHPVRAIALSGFGTESDVRETQEAGFAEHFSKPIDIRKLRATIERLVKQPPAGAGPNETTA